MCKLFIFINLCLESFLEVYFVIIKVYKMQQYLVCTLYWVCNKKFFLNIQL